jgi:hypothetical protein
MAGMVEEVLNGVALEALEGGEGQDVTETVHPVPDLDEC